MSRPAHKLRTAAYTSCIWRNTSDRGKTYYTATPQRSYKQGDDTWKETDSLNGDDLLAMAELLREAYVWIRNPEAGRRRRARSADNVTAK